VSHTLDLILNLEVFLFIGLLIWLYLKKGPNDGSSDEPE